MKPTGPGTSNPGGDILNEVRLEFFTAEPTSVAAFGESLLRWSVNGPAGFFVTFGGSQVERVGSQTERPGATSTYLLEARAGQDARVLGELTIGVDTSACSAVACSVPNLPDEVLRVLLGSVLAADTSLSASRPAEMTFQPGQMQIVFHLTTEPKWHGVKIAPDPEIDVTVRCGLRIDSGNGHLVTTNPSISASVTEPWYVNLSPVYSLILAFETDEKQNQIPMDFQPVVAGISGAIAFFFPITPAQRYQSVAIPGGGTVPEIQLIACPYAAA